MGLERGLPGACQNETVTPVSKSREQCRSALLQWQAACFQQFMLPTAPARAFATPLIPERERGMLGLSRQSNVGSDRQSKDPGMAEAGHRGMGGSFCFAFAPAR